jgi:hypothetical protein
MWSIGRAIIKEHQTMLTSTKLRSTASKTSRVLTITAALLFVSSSPATAQYLFPWQDEVNAAIYEAQAAFRRGDSETYQQAAMRARQTLTSIASRVRPGPEWEARVRAVEVPCIPVGEDILDDYDPPKSLLSGGDVRANRPVAPVVIPTPPQRLPLGMTRVRPPSGPEAGVVRESVADQKARLAREAAARCGPRCND